MAETQSNAPSCANSGATNAPDSPNTPSTPTYGVIHVRTRLTANFTVISNALAQRRGSAVTIGVAAYILSVPDGARISIAALCAHFDEGEILISRALRELEAAGHLERRRVRGPNGKVRTQTFFYDVPRGAGDRVAPAPQPPTRPAKPKPKPDSEPEPDSAEDNPPTATPANLPPVAPPPPPPPLGLDDADPQAVVILASLRIVDRRLILSRSEVAELAPAVSEWLAQGLRPEEITEALTTGLPAPFRARPARVLAYRLREAPLPAPPSALPAAAPLLPALRWQTCDGCERAFRAAEPSACRDCRIAEAA
ncbi:hypothetical protein [Streptomyces sp. SID12501]|uniref:Helix-turn-helix domain-containing protein n=1 Tax=Streptomyces sp. SID12501 TaxID=2706042 RepID=A0A6B3BPI6_9ACTN|nr:hypothetical protein [Streptomyces sp. SID12501]NEC86249.1 hypothetical protein [Streptomyces sp. SID12501]